MNLRINETRPGYHEASPDEKVRREVPDKLWNILGIFPSSGKLPEDVENMLRTMCNTVSLIRTIAENQIGHDDVKKKILESVMEFYQTEQEFSKRLRQLL